MHAGRAPALWRARPAPGDPLAWWVEQWHELSHSRGYTFSGPASIPGEIIDRRRVEVGFRGPADVFRRVVRYLDDVFLRWVDRRASEGRSSSSKSFDPGTVVDTSREIVPPSVRMHLKPDADDT